MYKNLFTRGLFTLVLCAMAVFTTQSLNAQCTNTSLYPSAAVSVDGAGALTTINGCNYLEEYSNVTAVLAASDYQFTVSGYITVYQDGTLLGHGDSPLMVTTASASDMEVHWNVDAACTTAGSCVTTTVQCMSCLSCAPLAADITLAQDCIADAANFYIDVDLTDIGDAASVDITDGTTTLATVTTTGMTTVGPFANGTAVDITLVHSGGDALCNTGETGIINNECPTIVNLTCASGPVSDSYCYDSNSTASTMFISDDGDVVTITFDAGNVENTYDELTVIDSDGSVMYSGYGATGDISGLTFTSTGDRISWGVFSDGSVSCVQGSTGQVAGIQYTVQCGAPVACGTPSNIIHALAAPARCNIIWDEVPGALRYDVHYRVSGTGPANWTRTGASSNSKSLHYLAPNTVYDYIVRATCDGTWDFAAASDVRRFNTANIATLPEARTMFVQDAMNISPNPARESINVAYAVSNVSDVNISIVDMMGRTVYNKQLSNVEGQQNEAIDVSTLGQGYYMLVLQSGDDKQVKKFATIR